MKDNIWNGLQPGGDNPTPADRLNLHPAVALVLLACLFVVCYIAVAVVVYLLGRALPGKEAAVLRIGAVVQDIILFMVPAVGTAVLASRRPADLLCIRRSPGLVPCLLAVGIMVVAIPALEGVIYWNYNWDWLPAKWETVARTMEDTAAATMNVLLQDTSVMALIVNVLIIGFAAGLCEELFFRGIFLGLLLRIPINRDVAVFLTAFIFSALHFQLFGFVPRLLLGLYFGYLLVWSRSLWLPVVAHVFNNSVYVVTAWWNARQGLDVDGEPELWSIPWMVLSVVLCAVGLWALWRHCCSGRRFISSM